MVRTQGQKMETMPGTDNNAEQHGTPPHGYERLLVQQIVGVYCKGVREEGDGAPQHPSPTTASTCSQDGPGANSHTPSPW